MLNFPRVSESIDRACSLNRRVESRLDQWNSATRPQLTLKDPGRWSKRPANGGSCRIRNAFNEFVVGHESTFARWNFPSFLPITRLDYQFFDPKISIRVEMHNLKEREREGRKEGSCLHSSRDTERDNGVRFNVRQTLRLSKRALASSRSQINSRTTVVSRYYAGNSYDWMGLGEVGKDWMER